MVKMDGKFKLESHCNAGPFMQACGMPEAMVKTCLDPKNEICCTMCQNEDGSFTFSVEHSLTKELDQTNTFKLGEELTIEKPIPCKMTVTKKSDCVFATRAEIGGNVMLEETTMHNYGFSKKACIEGKGVCMKQEWKRLDCSANGCFALASEEGLDALMKAAMPDLDTEQFAKVKGDMMFRMKECNGVFKVCENIGGQKKSYCFKLDESYDYCNAAFGIDETRLSTKVGPGMYKTVCKCKKTGKVTEVCMCVTEHGIKETVKCGAVEAKMCWKRVPDAEGTWKLLTHCGGENYLDAMGVPEPMKTEMLDARDTFCNEYIGGGKMKTTTDSKFMPKEMVVKENEEYCVEMPGLGTMKGITTCGPGNNVTSVIKMGGKTITMKEVFTGDFLVIECCVDGCKRSTCKYIYTRDC